jgi:hypothetical protein
MVGMRHLGEEAGVPRGPAVWTAKGR